MLIFCVVGYVKDIHLSAKCIVVHRLPPLQHEVLRYLLIRSICLLLLSYRYERITYEQFIFETGFKGSSIVSILYQLRLFFNFRCKKTTKV